MSDEIQKLGDEDVIAFLVGLLGPDVYSVEFLANGEWSRCFSFAHERRNQVIRFGNHPEDFQKDRIAGSYADSGLPVPEISAIGQAFGGHYAIAPHVYGKPLDQLKAAQWRAVLPELLKTLDAVRVADLSHSTGYGLWDADGRGPFGSWREFLLSAADDPPEQRTHGWRSRLHQSPDDESAFLQAFRLLESSVDRCPEVRHLVHSDLHLNLFVSGRSVTGLLDWGCSLYGDFLYDHAWLAYWAPWYPATEGIDFVDETLLYLRELGIDDDLEWRILCCQVHIGLFAVAYNAFAGRRADLTVTAQRTVGLARSLAKL